MEGEEFRCRVAEYREKLGISRRELSEATGISLTTLIRMEKETQAPNVLYVFRIVRYLNQPIEELFEYHSNCSAGL